MPAVAVGPVTVSFPPEYALMASAHKMIICYFSSLHAKSTVSLFDRRNKSDSSSWRLTVVLQSNRGCSQKGPEHLEEDVEG